MTHPHPRTPIAAAVIALTASLATGPVQGAGFALQENSGSGLGNAYAGGAAVAEDASTVWSNPAGMSKIRTPQVAAAIHIITPSMQFNNIASQPAQSQLLGGDGGDAGSTVFVPNAFLVVPLNPQWSFGVGFNAPFGLITEYDDTWIGRFQGVKSDVKTININPAISWKPVDNFAIGVGASFQRIKATLTQQVNYSFALLGAAQQNGIPAGSPTFNAIAASTPQLQSFGTVQGDDWSWGWNIGVLWDIDPNNRVGVHYRSSIKYDISGTATFANPTLPSTVPPALAPTVSLLAAGVNSQVLFNGGITSHIKLPQIANISYFGRLNDRWDLMADFQYTGWNSIQDLTFVRTTGSVLQSDALRWDNAWRYAAGVNYHYDPMWMFRLGVAYDETPTSDQFRTVRLPDNNRTWLAGGVQWKPNPQWALDVGVAYGWAGHPSINRNSCITSTSTALCGLINGDFDVHFLIVSGQVTYSF